MAELEAELSPAGTSGGSTSGCAPPGGRSASSAAAPDADADWSYDSAEISEFHQDGADRRLSASVEALQEEAEAGGYGKMYAAMGGGRDGLEACAAGEG